MAGVLDKAVIAAIDSGRVLNNQMQSLTILKAFHYPLDPFYWRHSITSPDLFKNLFGVHSVELQLKYCLPFKDFVSIRNLVNRCSTDMLPYFLKDFSSKYSHIAEGLGSGNARIVTSAAYATICIYALYQFISRTGNSIVFGAIGYG